jgi:hypothetical protein
MLRRYVTRLSMALALAGALMAVEASAMEEIVVYGSGASAAPVVDEAAFRAEMRRYLKGLHDQQKAMLNAELASWLADKERIATTDTPTRS